MDSDFGPWPNACKIYGTAALYDQIYVDSTTDDERQVKDFSLFALLLPLPSLVYPIKRGKPTNNVLNIKIFSSSITICTI